MRILVVSSYPPRHCGIGAYARAQVGRLRSEGHEVVVLSPLDGDGDIRVPFFGGRPFFRAARPGSRFDRVLVHFEPGLYFPRRAPVSKAMASLGLLWLVLKRPGTEILVHEAAASTRLWRPDHLLLRSVFARARLLFHTDMEREALERAYRVRVDGRLVPHTDGVQIHGQLSRGEARSTLWIDPHEKVLLCAGFLHPGKGFDRAVRAFARAGCPGRLFVVGSVRRATPENLGYVRELRRLCEATPGVTLVEEYVSDQDFDSWMIAADLLLLPYSRAWSSGALARARTLGTHAIVSAVGGLGEQAGPGDVVFETDEQLVELLRDPSLRPPAPAESVLPDPTPDSHTGSTPIFGVRLHERRSMAEVRRTLETFLDGDATCRVFTPNPEILLYAREHPDFAALLNDADLALSDGAGVALVQLLRTRRPIRRWPGVDVAEMAVRLAAERGDAVVFLGGEGDVAVRAAERWRTELPGLAVEAAGSGVRIGEDGVAVAPEEGRALIERIRAVEPRVVLVAFGAPKQERWIDHHAAEVPSARIMIGVGGTLDMWAGRFSRAPRPIHALGFEWAWRLAQQPSRLPRTARATVLFPWRALRERPLASGGRGRGRLKRGDPPSRPGRAHG